MSCRDSHIKNVSSYLEHLMNLTVVGTTACDLLKTLMVLRVRLIMLLDHLNKKDKVLEIVDEVNEVIRRASKYSPREMVPREEIGKVKYSAEKWNDIFSSLIK